MTIVNNAVPAIIAGVAGGARIENSTISANRGRMFQQCGERGCFIHSTIAGNFPDPTPDPICAGTAQLAVLGYVFFEASVVSNPNLTNCLLDLGYVYSSGHNIDSDGSCGLTDPTDLSNVDPMLGPLQSNGGSTPTHALLRGSAAIDRIPISACKYDHDGDPGTPEVALTQDQRCGARPREGDGAPPSGCDVGAYEVAACADGRDNDGDGFADFDGGATAGIMPLTNPDANCSSALGNVEARPLPPGCGLGPELVPALLLLRITGRRRERFPPRYETLASIFDRR